MKKTILNSVLIIIMDICFAFNIMNSIAFCAYIGMAILMLLLLFNSAEEHIYFFIAVSPFVGSVAINDKNILFVFLIFSLLKYLLYNRNKAINLRSISLLLYIFILEMINDYANVSVGRFIYAVSMAVYFIFYWGNIGFSKLNTRSLVLYSFIAFSLVLVLNLYVVGGLKNLGEFDPANRFGEEARELGGAMGLPIFCLLFITVILNYILTLEKTRIIVSIGCFVACIFIAFLGFHTVSKVFILGLLAEIILIFGSMIFSKYVKNAVLILSSVIIVGLIGFLLYNETLMQIIDAYLFRIKGDISTGRFEIFASCFEYWFSHPIAFFFGMGAYNYVYVGKALDYGFGIMAHNLLLDGIMAFGVIGMAFIILLIVSAVRKFLKKYPLKKKWIYFIPLIVWILCKMTGGSFIYLNSFAQPTFLLLFAMLSIKEKYEADNAEFQAAQLRNSL